MRALILALLVAVLSPLAGDPALAAPSLSVRVETTPGEGRLFLGWDAPAKVRTAWSGRRLTLRFDRPFAAELLTAMARLSPWLSDLAASARPGELSLELRAGVDAEVASGPVAATTVVVLRRSPAHAETASAAPPDPVPAVRVRGGAHPGFGRLALESDTPLGFRVRREGDQLFLTAGADLPDRAAAQARALPRWVVRAGLDGRTLRLLLRPGVVVREQQLTDTKLVLDLATPAPRESASRDPRPHAPVPTAVPRRSEALPGVAGATVADPPGEEEGRAPMARAALAREVAPAGGPVEARTPSVAPRAAPDAFPAGASASSDAIVTFRWRRPVAAAAFERADVVWIVFGATADEIAGVDRPKAGAAGLRELGRVGHKGLTAFRYLRAGPGALNVTGGGATWHLRRGEPSSGEGQEVTAELGPDGRLVLAAAAGVPALVADPEVGDTLGLLLAPDARSRLSTPRAFVDLELLPSLAGVAWRPVADGVSAVPGQGRVEIFRPGGLRSASGPVRPGPATLVGPPKETAQAAATSATSTRPHPAAPSPGHAARPSDDRTIEASGREPTDQPPVAAIAVEPLALAGISDRARPSFAARRRELLDGPVRQPGEEGVSARLRLARLFLADALGAEALATLDPSAPDDPAEAVAGQPARQDTALRAVAELLLGRERRAGELLASVPAGNDAELALWRAAAAAALERWDEAARELKGAGSVWADYPPRLRFRLGLTVATVLAQAGRVDPALAVLDKLVPLAADRSETARLALVKAVLLDRDGRDATATFTRAARDGGLEFGVAARFSGIVSALERGRLSADEARRRLTTERLLWRGHAREPRMLDTLAGLEAGTGDAIAALATWRTILSREPDEATAGHVVERMRKATMVALAADGPAAVDPVAALALLRASPTILPDSDAGRRLTEGLAARLAETGLPAQAAGLLDERRGTAGPPTTPGSLDVARYRLAADDPGGALAALVQPGPAAGDKDGQLRPTEARALLALGRPADALRRLERLPGREASELRGLALWRLQDWPRLREELGAGAAGAGGGPDDERRVRDAIASGRVGTAPVLGTPPEAGLGQVSRAVVGLIAASAPLAGPARAATDDLAPRIATLRSGLDTLRTPQ